MAKNSHSLIISRWYQRHLPNIFTFFRLLSVPIIFALIISHRYLTAFSVFAFAGISDWADGYFARKWDVESSFGRIFDPIADKALMVICFVLLGIKDALPFWLVGMVVARDVLILFAGFYAFLANLKIKFQPILVSKLNTFLQILLVGTSLIAYSDFSEHTLAHEYFTVFQVIHWIYFILMFSCVITTLWSGWRYGVYFIQEVRLIKGDRKS